jgi:hypothetical protein
LHLALRNVSSQNLSLFKRFAVLCTLPYVTFLRKTFLYSNVSQCLLVFGFIVIAKQLSHLNYIVYITAITNKFRVKLIGLSTVNYTSLKNVTSVSIFNVANVDISRKCNILQSFCLKQRQVSK